MRTELEFGLTMEQGVSERLVEITERFLGYPYIRFDELKPQDENGEPFAGFDCMTYVECSLALAISSSTEEFKRNILAIRYYDSVRNPSYRKHFAYLDWLQSNRWLLEERNGFEGDIATITKVIDRKSFYISKNLELPPLLKPVEKVVIPYIPVAALITLVHSVYVVLFISGADGLDVQHMGFCVRKGRDYVLRHASSVKGKVVEEPFIDYLYGSDAIGVVFAVPREKEVEAQEG